MAREIISCYFCIFIAETRFYLINLSINIISDYNYTSSRRWKNHWDDYLFLRVQLYEKTLNSRS